MTEKGIENGQIKEQNKKVPKNYYGEIMYKSDWEKHIEHMLFDNWEGNEEILSRMC